MKYSIVNKSSINLGDRIDAEYFEPSYLDNENKLKALKAKPLSDYCKLASSAFYPAATELYATGILPFIRCVDCIDYPAITTLQNEYFERLPQTFVERNRTIKVLTKGDLVITKVGSPCYTSVVYDLNEVALSRTVLGVYKIHNIDPFYLAIYLRSRYGFEQLIRERELTIQYQLTLERVGRIRIYKPIEKDIEFLFRDIFIKSQQLNKLAVEQYKSATEALLKELNLFNWKPKHCLSYIKNYTDTQTHGRIDAEYYQPIYDQILDKIKKYKYGCKYVKDVVNVKKGNYVPTGKKTYKYIELANISSNGSINGFTQALGVELPSRARRKVNNGDLIISTIEGSLSSIALINEDLNNAICSTGFFVVNSKEIESETLLVLFKSIVGQMQLKKGCSGTILTAINDNEFSKILIPIIPANIQGVINAKITDMYKAKESSNKLLTIAKQGVEMAIEKNEKEAEKWIHTEVKKLNIKI